MRRAGVLLVALCAAACRSPTQITFDVTTDVDCGAIQSTSLIAGPLAALDDGRPATTTAPRCTSGGHIGSLVVLPSGGDDDLVAVKIVTGVDVAPDQCGPHGEGCIVAKRALHFEPHTPLTVNVTMSAKCKGINCSGEETCVEGVCRSALIGDPSTCSGSGCSESSLAPVDGGAPVGDGGAAIDATLANDGASDASIDGPISNPLPEAGPSPPGPAIGISINFACALRPDHTVWCWGNDTNGELGDGYEDAATFVATPVQVAGLDHVTRLTVGEEHACAVIDDGGVSCWGYGTATGTNDVVDDLVPTHVNGISAVGLIAAGQYHTCAASLDGRTIWCWGTWIGPSDGNDPPFQLAPVNASIVEMAAGRALTCGRFDDGVVRCWGENDSDGLGQGTSLATTATSTTPLAVPGLVDTTQIAVGYAHVCALDSSHVVRCWGENDQAQLGPVDAGDPAASPTPLALDPHVTKVAVGVTSGCALFDDAGTLCWGYDYEGELGVNDTASGSKFITPITIPGLGPASDVFAGGYGQCAILVDGGVVCWGNDTERQLGSGAQLPDMPIGAFNVVF